MRALIIMLVTLFIAHISVGQENPWERKKTTNPWGTQEQESSAKVEKSENDTTSKTIITPFPLSESDVEDLYYLAEEDAKESYDATGDFIVGFLCGGLISIGAIPIVGASAAIPTKKEKAIVDSTLTIPAYQELDQEKLNKRTTNALKQKRLLKGIGGALTGAAVQLGVIVIALAG